MRAPRPLLCTAAAIMSCRCPLGKAFVPARLPVRGLGPAQTSCRDVRAKSLALLAGKDGDTAATAIGSASPLSRARGVVVDPAFRNMLGPMAASGALLGPNLDSYHSAFGVLTYKNPITLSVGMHTLVTTDWWWVSVCGTNYWKSPSCLR